MKDNNKDRITKYVEDYLKLREWSEIQDIDKVRFSVTLDSLENARLEMLLQKIGMKKTDFISDAIKLLVAEFETQLKLDPDNNKEHWKEIMKYHKQKNLKENENESNDEKPKK